MFQETNSLDEKRTAAIEQLGGRYVFHPDNQIKRKPAENEGLRKAFSKPAMTAADLVAYYNMQPPAMQGALRAFWRTLVSVPHTGRIFDEALAHVHHEEHKHHG